MKPCVDCEGYEEAIEIFKAYKGLGKNKECLDKITEWAQKSEHTFIKHAYNLAYKLGLL